MPHIHLFIDAVDALDTSLNNRFLGKVLLRQTLPDTLFDGADKRLTLVLFDLHDVFNFRIGKGVQIIERQVFQLFFDGADSETVCNGRINIHGFQRNSALFGGRQEAECAHVVNAVCQLDNHHTNVMGHGKEDFSHILCLLLFLVKDGNTVQFCNAVHQNCHILPKFFPDVVQRVLGILYHIMKQADTDRIGVHAKIYQNHRHRQRMDDIRFTRGTCLRAVCLLGELIGRYDLAQIVLLVCF